MITFTSCWLTPLVNVTVTFSSVLSVKGSDILFPICLWLRTKSEAAWFLCMYFRTSSSSFSKLFTRFATGFRSFTNFFGFIAHNVSKSMQDADSFIWQFLFSNKLLSHLNICASFLVRMYIGRIAINKSEVKY